MCIYIYIHTHIHIVVGRAINAEVGTAQLHKTAASGESPMPRWSEPYLTDAHTTRDSTLL